MTTATGAATGAPGSRLARVGGTLILIAALSAVFLVFAHIGALQVARGARVLNVLTPLISWLRTTGAMCWTWLLAHSLVVGELVSGASFLVFLVGLLSRRWSALPLGLMALSVSSATWGEILLLADRGQLGLGLYAVGLVSACVLGIWCPIRRLPGFLDLPFPPGAQPVADPYRTWSLPWAWECVLVFLLTVGGLLVRLYALPELPNHLDLEMVESMVASRTTAGFRWWLQDGLMGYSGGFLHLLPKKVIFDLFGSSIYAFRLSSVFFGVLAIPLMYWLVRRLAGWGAAVAATTLLLSAPEQLFWSRTENVAFSVIALIALVTAHTCIWMMQRFSIASVLTAALWMPICRFSYAPGFPFFLLPLAVLGHATVFVRGMWRKLWYALPVLAGGAVLWYLSLSILFCVVGDGHWRFIDPANMQGGPLWRKQGQYLEASPAELVVLQARSITSNLGIVIDGMANHVDGFSHWNERMDLSPRHLTMITVGITVLASLGLAYFLAQVSDRRCFALLVWVGIALLPGVMSNEPADRRISGVFPGLYVIVGVFLAAGVRIARRGGGRIAAWLASAAAGAVVAGIAAINLVSHFLLPAGLTALEGPIRFVAPMFTAGDTIVHNVDHAMAIGMIGANLDRFLQPDSTPCIQEVNSKTWLEIGLNPRCDFSDRAYLATMPSARVAQLKAQYHPQRVTFLLQDTPYNRSRIDVLRALYPAGLVRTYEGQGGMISLFALTVSVDDIAALHTPTLHLRGSPEDAARLRRGVLAGVNLMPVVDAEGETLRVEGGLLLEHDGWYRVGVEPTCAAAQITVDREPLADAARPMVAGVHPFEIVLPNPTACELPLRIAVRPAPNQEDTIVLRPEFLVSSVVASQPEAQALPVASYPGFGRAQRFLQGAGWMLDFGVDAGGQVTALLRDGQGVHVTRFDQDGRQQTTWQPQLPPERGVSMIAVDSAGTVFLYGDGLVLVHDRDGHRLYDWTEPLAWPDDITFWGDDQVLTTLRDRNVVALLDRHGKGRAELKDFEGGAGRLLQPVNVTANGEGDILVVQGDGTAVLFKSPGETWHPTFVRSFRVAYNSLPPQLRHAAFDGTDHVLLPDQLGTWVQPYTLRGERLMAADPAHDLSALDIGQAVRIVARPEGLYVLDLGGRLWRIARPTAGS